MINFIFTLMLTSAVALGNKPMDEGVIGRENSAEFEKMKDELEYLEEQVEDCDLIDFYYDINIEDDHSVNVEIHYYFEEDDSELMVCLNGKTYKKSIDVVTYYYNDELISESEADQYFTDWQSYMQ